MKDEKQIEKECFEIAKRYIQTEKKMSPDKYELSYLGKQPDSDLYRVNAIHEEDKTSAVPGGGTGKSVQLWIDPEKQKVEKVLRWQ